MNYALVLRLEARTELDQAYRWYEGQQVGLGDDFLEQVQEALLRISQLPESYPTVYRDVRRTVGRRFSYNISYRIVSSRVIVTAVLHGRRNPKAW
jgi:plasmid stabilization system protein ParE